MKKPRKPIDGQLVLVKIRYRDRATDGKGKTWMQKWRTTELPATYYKETFPSGSGHFHGNFGFSDADCVWRYVEIIDWIGS